MLPVTCNLRRIVVIGNNEASFHRDALGQNRDNGTNPQVNPLGTRPLFQGEQSNSKYRSKLVPDLQLLNKYD